MNAASVRPAPGGPAANGSSELPAATVAYNRLRAEILSGPLQPGERLLPADLRARYGLGLTPIREALTRLASEGLIEAVERAGHPFAVGVQWHPELSSEGSPHDRLFQGLVSAARLRSVQRQLQTTG